jgi:hypothetical protein
MNKTRIIALATILAVAGAGQASAGGLLGGLGILNGNKTGGVVIAPSVGVGVGNILSDNDGNNVLNGVLNGTLSGVLNGNTLGILGGSDCGCKKRKH